MLSIIKNNPFFSPAEKEYFSKRFVDLIEDHASYLTTHSSSTVLFVEPIDTIKYRADIYDFFRSRKIPTILWVPIIVVNKIRDPQNFNESWSNKEIIVPEVSVVRDLLQTSKRK